MRKIFVSSDWHFNHANICKGTSTWEDTKECRDFKNTQEMDQAIIDSINKTVGFDDKLIFLGDFYFSGFGKTDEEKINEINNYFIRITCNNIAFMYGNHDNFIQKNSFNVIHKVQFLNNQINSVKFNKADLKEFGLKSFPRIVFSHYPLMSWEEKEKGSIMVHGHCHQRCPDVEYYKHNKLIDVGIDCNEFRPLELSEIKAKIDARIIH
jgi:calcineurin-like phosphoesterase family protein